MANKFYPAVALTGGGTGALDKIDGDSLSDLDAAIVVTSNKAYFYTLDASSGASESSPGVISPDSNAGNKRWVLQGNSLIGDYTGNWATSTVYAKRELVKDTSNNNVYLCNTAHTSSGSQPISTNTDVAKWDLIVNAAAASTSATNAAASETAAAASETAAAASETAAETAETNAETAKTAAETAQTSAETAKSAADTAQAAAETAETNAETSETNASTSASAASTSASAASTSASSASTSASAASTSASSASTSASSASTSASNASASETSAISAVGALAWKYTFDSTTSMADPGAGEIRFDNATVASVTNLAMDATSADSGNPDISDLIASIDDGSNDAHEGFITIRKSGTPDTFACYSVTGAITDNTGWLQVPVTHVASNSTISNTDTLYISFIRTGAKGDTGATGPAGAGSDTPPDNVFRIQDQTDTTKQIAFEASGITTSTTRTVTMPDKDLTLIDEGADLKSTGESGGTKYLREDGDGTSSWQVPDHDALTNFASNEHYTQANITATGTIASGTWNGTSIGTTYTDAKVTSVSGSTGAVADGDIDHDQLANFASNEHFTQANITATGTIASGTWQGTAVDGTYVDLEGTEVKSTGEGGGTKYLREDGDGTCSWQTITSGGLSLGTDSIIRTNLKTIDENITFAGNENGSTVGPITISDGYTVTVTAGSTWTVI